MMIKTNPRMILLAATSIAMILLAFSSCSKDNDDNPNTTSTFTDPRDGIVYKTVTIGNQTWMAENLKYLPAVFGPGSGSQTDPRYYVYGYDGTIVSEAKATPNYSTYGVLYNWPSAMSACPAGWHLPTDAEWTQLSVFLGESDAGGKLKETGTTHWNDPNFAATNETGFTALPGGYCFSGSSFNDMGIAGYWWSATEANNSGAWYRGMGNNYSELIKVSNYKNLGFSVRCVKD
jgi:uncharacterized protein (TIGR02145 family)